MPVCSIRFLGCFDTYWMCVLCVVVGVCLRVCVWASAAGSAAAIFYRIHLSNLTPTKPTYLKTCSLNHWFSLNLTNSIRIFTQKKKKVISSYCKFLEREEGSKCELVSPHITVHNLSAMSQVWWMPDIQQDSVQTRPLLLQYLQSVGRREINNKASKVQ